MEYLQVSGIRREGPLADRHLRHLRHGLEREHVPVSDQVDAKGHHQHFEEVVSRDRIESNAEREGGAEVAYQP